MDQSVADARHPAGCFHGGPAGGAFWFAVESCELDHASDLPPLFAPRENAELALEHLRLAGLTNTGEQ